MTTKEDIIAAIQRCADISGDLALRRALGSPENGPVMLRGEAVETGIAYEIPGFLNCLLQGIVLSTEVANVTVQDEGSTLTTGVKKLNFVGGGVTATETADDEIDVTIPTGASIEVQDEGNTLTQSVKQFNFVGAMVSATEPTEDEITVTVGDIAQEKIYYVGKHGNNDNTGRNIGEAFLTIAAAGSAVNLQNPGEGNKFAIVILDAGAYEESNTVPTYTHLYAPNATLIGNYHLSSNSRMVTKILIGNHTVSDGSEFVASQSTTYSGVSLLKSGGTGYALGFVNHLNLQGNSLDGVVVTSGEMDFNVGRVTYPRQTSDVFKASGSGSKLNVQFGTIQN
jgi:hypothetical protein